MKAILAALGLIGLSAPAVAHHSFAMFDKDHPMQIQGTVKEFQWANPHSWVQFMAPYRGAIAEWSIEGRSPNVLVRRGWTRETLKPGDKVTLTIYPLKSGKAGGAIVNVKFANGRLLNADTPTAVDTDEEGAR